MSSARSQTAATVPHLASLAVIHARQDTTLMRLPTSANLMCARWRTAVDARLIEMFARLARVDYRCQTTNALTARVSMPTAGHAGQMDPFYASSVITTTICLTLNVRTQYARKLATNSATVRSSARRPRARCRTVKSVTIVESASATSVKRDSSTIAAQMYASPTSAAQSSTVRTARVTERCVPHVKQTTSLTAMASVSILSAWPLPALIVPYRLHCAKNAQMASGTIRPIDDALTQHARLKTAMSVVTWDRPCATIAKKATCSAQTSAGLHRARLTKDLT